MATSCRFDPGSGHHLPHAFQPSAAKVVRSEDTIPVRNSYLGVVTLTQITPLPLKIAYSEVSRIPRSASCKVMFSG